jgi:hypothetical protein
VGDRQDEHVLLVLFERDHVGEPLDGRLADQQACGPRMRPWRLGFWGVANSTEGSRNLGDELPILGVARRTKGRRCEAQRVPQDAVRGARRCSSSSGSRPRGFQLIVCTRPSATSRERRSAGRPYPGLYSSDRQPGISTWRPSRPRVRIKPGDFVRLQMESSSPDTGARSGGASAQSRR